MTRKNKLIAASTAKKSSKEIVKYKKSPEAPRRFKSAYMFFSTEKHKEIRKEMGDTEIATTEVAKLVSKAWKALPPEEREKWDRIAARDKERFEMEKAMYKGPWKVPISAKPTKDPDAPKRPMSAFLSFSNCKRSCVKRENPKVQNAGISRLLAKLWSDAPEEERKFHIEQEFRLRQKYKGEIAAWKEKVSNELLAARQEREERALQAVDESRTCPLEYRCESTEPYDTPSDFQDVHEVQGSPQGVTNTVFFNYPAWGSDSYQGSKTGFHQEPEPYNHTRGMETYSEPSPMPLYSANGYGGEYGPVDDLYQDRLGSSQYYGSTNYSPDRSMPMYGSSAPQFTPEGGSSFYGAYGP